MKLNIIFACFGIFNTSSVLTKTETFMALYNSANCINYSCFNPNVSDQIESPDAAQKLFAENCLGTSEYCDYVNGRYMKLSFDQFPNLDTDSYDQYTSQSASVILKQACWEKAVKYKAT